MFFDASENDISSSLDLDALHFLENDEALLLSFDGSGRVAGTSLDFDDEDVLRLDLATGDWTLLYDGSVQHPEWPRADLDALFAVELPVTYSLTIELVGSGDGRVLSLPQGIDCGATCSADFVESSIVELIATAALGSQFAEWGGDGECLDGVLTMTSNRNCQARFEPASGLIFADGFESGDTSAWSR